MDAGEVYERLWADASAAFARREPRLDPVLFNKHADRRRGVSLIFRIAPPVLDRVTAFLDRLRSAFPEQYFYAPGELHVTVMAVLSGSLAWRTEYRRLIGLREVVDRALQGRHPFEVHFRGITASPETIMIQGFPVASEPSGIRDALRRTFREVGWQDQLDRRYRIRTAHCTAVRFRDARTDWHQLAACLGKARDMDFGTQRVDRLQLVWSDWYSSSSIVRVLREYPLPEA